MRASDRTDAIVIGGGQAGLSVGHHLARRGLSFVILDANERVGDSWRHRWDSLRLFTPARFSSLDGLPFPGPPDYFPTKDELADYLEAYARHFDLPVRSGVRVHRLTRAGEHFEAYAGDERFEAANVIVAMSSDQRPWRPDFAEQLDPEITQLHSAEYRHPGQLRDGPVLLVGAANSGADIAMELVRDRRVWISGRDVGHVPFRIEDGLALRFLVPFVLRFVFHRVLTVDTPIGRRRRPVILRRGDPLVRVKPKDLVGAGVERVPRTVEVRNGQPVTADGRVLAPANVIWCTGYRAPFDWIDLPVHGELEPRHRSGIVDDEPGLYFVGLPFLHAHSSSMIHGVGRDAARIADLIEERVSGQAARGAIPQPAAR